MEWFGLFKFMLPVCITTTSSGSKVTLQLYLGVSHRSSLYLDNKLEQSYHLNMGSCCRSTSRRPGYPHKAITQQSESTATEPRISVPYHVSDQKAYVDVIEYTQDNEPELCVS